MKTDFKREQQNSNGMWFFGLAGSGKTFASQICAQFIEKAFLIDGDEVRKLISFDLGYSSPDRKVQIKRVFGLAQIAISNYQFPIISTVTMTEEICQNCSQVGIEVLQIIRPITQLHSVRRIYATDQNVVGKDIHQIELNTNKLYNSGGPEFEEALKKLC